MQVSVVQGAPTGQRFSPDAFAGQLGRQVGLFSGDPAVSIGVATIVAAVVATDGTSVVLTMDLPGGVIGAPLGPQTGGVRGDDELRLRSNPKD